MSGWGPRPSDLFLGALGRACPAPTPRPCKGEACLAFAPHAPAAGKEVTRSGYRSLQSAIFEL